MKQKRTSGSGLFDKLLVPRIENYGANNDITDTGATAVLLGACALAGGLSPQAPSLVLM